MRSGALSHVRVLDLSTVLAESPRFATNAARGENRTALVAILQALLAGRPTRDWVGALEEAGVPCGPINDLAEVFEDPHVRARGLRVEVPHSLAGRVPVVASPMRLSQTPVRHGTPPLLSEHTREVLGDVLGMGEAEIEALRRDGVI
jgi:crotonobetainyl-CoA:carnitine CoA-transferase CaiB-like acyl-CoA transferase